MVGRVEPEFEKVTFIIATYNRESLLQSQISRIETLADSAKVIVIDDGSEDKSFSLLQSRLGRNPSVTLLRNQMNMGSAFCWNLGIAETSTAHLVFLPDDALELLPNAEAFIEAVKVSMRMSDVAGIHVEEEVPFNVPIRGTFRDVISHLLYAVSGQVVSTNEGHERYSDFVPGVMAIKRKVGMAVRFDDTLLIGNGFREESDFQLRARRLGFKILYNPAMGVRHRPHKSGGQIRKYSARGYAFWAVRNQVVFMGKNHLTLWEARCVFFILYQMVLHRATPATVSEAVREGMKALSQQETT